MKRTSIFKLISVSAFLFLCAFSMSFNASPLDENVPASENAAEVAKKDHEFFVSNSRDLALRANGVAEGDKIILTNDIDLDTQIHCKTSFCLDLNGHTISVPTDNEAFIIGQKEFSHVEKYTVTTPGYYTWESKFKTVEHPPKLITNNFGQRVFVHVPSTEEITRVQVWHPETSEVRYRDIYKYNDNIDVIIKNGKVKKLAGNNGKDGIKDVWFDFNGASGATPTAPIQIISGNVRFQNIKVKGGNGGNGGNGSYQALVHLVFGGGNAGNGGNGGNGGGAVYLERKECRAIKDQPSKLVSGKAGKGGKSGEVNPHYWLYSGWTGTDGKDGESSTPVVIS